jgi:hypothetical protein
MIKNTEEEEEGEEEEEEEDDEEEGEEEPDDGDEAIMWEAARQRIVATIGVSDGQQAEDVFIYNCYSKKKTEAGKKKTTNSTVLCFANDDLGGEFVIQNKMKSATASYSVKEHGESGAPCLARSWCHRMNFFAFYWYLQPSKDFDEDHMLDMAEFYIEPEDLGVLARTVHFTSRTWGRIREIRNIFPRRPAPGGG